MIEVLLLNSGMVCFKHFAFFCFFIIVKKNFIAFSPWLCLLANCMYTFIQWVESILTE